MSFTKLFTPTDNSARKMIRKNLVVDHGYSEPATVTTGAAVRTFKASKLKGPAAVAISGISKAADGIVTTATAHGITSGDYAFIKGVVGMIEMNYRHVVATVTSPTTYATGVNTSGLTTYTSGGTSWWRKAPESGSSIPVDGMSSASFWVNNLNDATDVTAQLYVNDSEDEPVPWASATFAANDWVTSGSGITVSGTTQQPTATYIRESGSAWTWVCLVLVVGAGTADLVSARTNIKE